MALIRKTHQARNYGKSWINVSTNGRIVISTRVALSLNLSKGDFIAFYQDDVRKKDWYIAKEKEGILVSGNGNVLKVSSVAIATDILNSISCNKEVKIKVSTAVNENGMFAILTESAVDMRGNKIIQTI